MSRAVDNATVLVPGTVLALCDFETTGVDVESDEAIEVGLLLLDDTLTVIGAFESLIKPPTIVFPDFLPAFKVHGILPHELNDAPDYAATAKAIDRIVRSRQGKRGKVTLCSDNIVFETAFMRKLFRASDVEWPFHYCGHDTSMLLDATKVFDPKPKHRAMADVGLVYRALLEAHRRVSQ